MPQRSQKLLVALALAVVTVAIYVPVLDNGFVNYDDDLYIARSSMVRQGLTTESVTWAFTTMRGANWFPLTWVSWQTDAHLFGMDPGAFHRTSLALHVANTVLLFVALAGMTGTLWRSAFVAAVFAWHPLHVESVAWAAARKDVLSGLFAMLALVSYARYARAPSTGRRAAVFASLALGLMAKPTLVVLPFVFLLLDVWPLGRMRLPGVRTAPDALSPANAVLEKLSLFVLVAGACAVTYHAQQSGGTVQSFEQVPLDERLGNALVSYVSYITRSFWPAGLTVFYPHPGASLSVWKAALAAILLVAFTFFALRQLRERPYLAVGWLWYLGALVPVIGLVQVGSAAMADRYTYLSQTGLAIALVWGVADLAAGRAVGRRALAVGGVSVLAAFAVVTHLQARRWKDSTTLFEHALLVTERNPVAHTNLGAALRKQERLDEAQRHLEEALRISPLSATALGILGEVHHLKGHQMRAVRLFRRALELEPDSPRWHGGVGDALMALGQLDGAIDSYERVIERTPDDTHAVGNLGLALYRKGQYRVAAAHFEKVLESAPLRADVRTNLAMALDKLGDDDRAIDELERALEVAPDLAAAHAHLGRLQVRRGQREAGIAHLTDACRLAPDNIEMRVLLAHALQQARRFAAAAEVYRELLRLEGRTPQTLNNLAWLLAASGSGGPRAEEAVRLAEEAALATGESDPGVLDTLALAYTAAGRPAEAAAAAVRAAALAEAEGDSALADQIRSRHLP